MEVGQRGEAKGGETGVTGTSGQGRTNSDRRSRQYTPFIPGSQAWEAANPTSQTAELRLQG